MTTKKPAKKAPKFTRRIKKAAPEKPSVPVEVLVYDPIYKTELVAEYRHESKWWYGTKLYKVYHPTFAEQTGEAAYRWITEIQKFLGPVEEAEA